MCVYILCMHVCMDACVCMHAQCVFCCMHTCMHTTKHTLCMHTHTCIHAHMHTQYIYTHTHLYTHMHTKTCMHVCIHMHMHTHTLTDMHTYIPTALLSFQTQVNCLQVPGPIFPVWIWGKQFPSSLPNVSKRGQHYDLGWRSRNFSVFLLWSLRFCSFVNVIEDQRAECENKKTFQLELSTNHFYSCSWPELKKIILWRKCTEELTLLETR